MAIKSSFFLSLRYEVSLSLARSSHLYMKLIKLFDIKMTTLRDSFVNPKNVKFIKVFQSKISNPNKGVCPSLSQLYLSTPPLPPGTFMLCYCLFGKECSLKYLGQWLICFQHDFQCPLRTTH